MKQLLAISLLALADQPIFAEQPACQNLMPMEWSVSSIGLNDAREMQLGTGLARMHDKNKLQVNLIETSPLGSSSRAFSIEFNDRCYGVTDSGRRVYLNIHRGGKRATLLWLDANEVRKVEMEAE